MFYFYNLLQKTQLGKHAKATAVSLLKILESFGFLLSSRLTQRNYSYLQLNPLIACGPKTGQNVIM
jgi:hypothetical protein